MNILICEEEDVLLTALEFRLRKYGFDVIRAKTGSEAIDLIKAATPDLVVTDLMMPEINGLDLLQFIRNDLKSKLPFVVISEIENDELILQVLEEGASDFVSKPFNPNELILRIRRIFRQLEKS